MAKIKQASEVLTCAYCGKVKQEIAFCIGASIEPDWCMVEGTGKITCPDCYNKAILEGRQAIDRHIAWVNGQV